MVWVTVMVWVVSTIVSGWNSVAYNWSSNLNWLYLWNNYIGNWYGYWRKWSSSSGISKIRLSSSYVSGISEIRLGSSYIRGISKVWLGSSYISSVSKVWLGSSNFSSVSKVESWS